MYWFERINLAEPLKGVRVAYAGPAPISGLQADELRRESHSVGYDEASGFYNQQILELRNDASYLQESVLQKIQEQFDRAMEEINSSLPKLLLSMVRGIWGELALDQNSVKKIVEEVLSDLSPEEEALEISLCPADLALLGNGPQAPQNRYPAIVVKENPNLQSGDCMVRSRFGAIDATVATKIKKIEKELLEV